MCCLTPASNNLYPIIDLPVVSPTVILPQPRQNFQRWANLPENFGLGDQNFRAKIPVTDLGYIVGGPGTRIVLYTLNFFT